MKKKLEQIFTAPQNNVSHWASIYEVDLTVFGAKQKTRTRLQSLLPSFIYPYIDSRINITEQIHSRDSLRLADSAFFSFLMLEIT